MCPKTISAESYLQRETQLIEFAKTLVGEGSISSLNMDALVAAAPFSKGTIYKHFCSKEDLILAICNKCINGIQQFFERALKFNGSSRERIVAVVVSYLIWAKLNPSQLMLVLSAHSPTVVANSSTERNELHRKLENDLMSLFNEEIASAIELGDLPVDESMTHQQISFACWSTVWGAMVLIMGKGESKELQSMFLERETLSNARILLDGLNWKPLSYDFDYRHTIKRVCEELFQQEITQLQNQGAPFVHY